MSVIEDTRKVAQDFLAPELRAISARLDALEQRLGGVDRKIDERCGSLDRKVDERCGSLDRKVDEVDRRAEKRHDQVMAAIAGLADFSSLRERVARLESTNAPHQ
jgi:tetrahydromethanopterin S-methyltransferase subunit G